MVERCRCSRCGLVVLVPVGGRSVLRLGPCPSCDQVGWVEASLNG